VRRPAGWNEMNLVKIETAIGGAGHGKMAIVNGIERAAKKRDTARRVFCGCAVRLRCGQRGSREKLRLSSHKTKEKPKN
jgi:hypothetical protein